MFNWNHLLRCVLGLLNKFHHLKGRHINYNRNWFQHKTICPSKVACLISTIPTESLFSFLGHQLINSLSQRNAATSLKLQHSGSQHKNLSSLTEDLSWSNYTSWHSGPKKKIFFFKKISLLPKMALNSWAQAILLSQPPEYLRLKVKWLWSNVNGLAHKSKKLMIIKNSSVTSKKHHYLPFYMPGSPFQSPGLIPSSGWYSKPVRSGKEPRALRFVLLAVTDIKWELSHNTHHPHSLIICLPKCQIIFYFSAQVCCYSLSMWSS